ncbi:MAG: PAS domain-containing protein [Deltaproteobacteria bacterium]|nr:PAS domain-containing protein [Deltaproteobacteria bacterium]
METKFKKRQYRLLAENARDMIYRMSLPDGRYEYVSPASIVIFGYPPETFYDTPVIIKEIIHPDWKGYFVEKWAELISGNMPPFYEYQIIHKSGEVKWLHQRNVLIRDDNGSPVAIEGIVTDVTERKQAEEGLKLLLKMTQEIAASEDFHSSIGTTLKEVCGFTGWCFAEAWVPSGEILECSPVWFSSGHLDDFRAGSQKLTFRRGISLPGIAWATGKPEWYQYLSGLPDNIFVRASIASQSGLRSAFVIPVTAESQVLAVLVFFMFRVGAEDKRLTELVSGITAQLGSLIRRKRAEERIREAEGKYRQLVEQLPSTIWIYTAKADDLATTIYVSPQIEALGFTQEEWIEAGDLWSRQLHPEDRERVLAEFRSGLENGRPIKFEYRMITRDKKVRWFRDEAALVRDEKHNRLFFHGVMFDITERKHAEELLFEKTSELDSMNRELHALTMELTELEEKDRKKFAVMLHENIGQNLVAVKMALGNIIKLQSEANRKALSQAITILDDTIKGARSMTTDLYPVPVDDRPLDGSIKWYAESFLEPKGIKATLNFDFSSDELTNEMKKVVYRIVRECLQNTVKYASASSVRISCINLGGKVIVSVKDDGKGFIYEDMIFKKGSGFGLLLMREWARSLNGELQITSKPGEGTEVKVFLTSEGGGIGKGIHS